jgi:hypothetical protein
MQGKFKVVTRRPRRLAIDQIVWQELSAEVTSVLPGRSP